MSQESKQSEEMREEYDIRGGVRGKYYERYEAMRPRMTNADRIVSWLAEHPEGADDDELSAMLGIRPRQQVNKICRESLFISRVPDPVTGKIRNYYNKPVAALAQVDELPPDSVLREPPPAYAAVPEVVATTPSSQARSNIPLIFDLFSSIERLKESVVELYYRLHGGPRQRFGWWMVNFLEGEGAIRPNDKNSIDLVCAMRNLMAHATEYPDPPDDTIRWMMRLTKEISESLKALIDRPQ